MPQLPSGSVTFLFTDIEGSTQFWERHAETMREAVALHDTVLQRTIAAHRGHVFKTMGDAFFAAFQAAKDAVQAAAEAQHALQRELPQLRVRMAISSGQADVRGGDYFGPVLNRVARLLAAGYGGQVLLSQETVRQLRSVSQEEYHLRPLGEHRLRDLSREALFQLVIPGLPSTFPPPNTLDVAFRRGVRRAAMASGVVLTGMGGLATLALIQARRAEEQQRVAEVRLYAAQMKLAQQAWNDGNIGLARELLEAHEPVPGRGDLRGFEWGYLQRLCQGEQLATLHDPTGPVVGIAFSPDGQTLASASLEGCVRLWSVPRQQGLAVLQEATSAGGPVAFSPDGLMLAAGTNHAITLWDAAGHRKITSMHGHSDRVTLLAFSPDGRLLASASRDRTVRTWDTATHQQIAASPAHALSGREETFGAMAMVFSPDGRSLALGLDGSNKAEIWDVRTLKQVAVLQAGPGYVTTVAYSPDGTILAVGSYDNTVVLWETATHRIVRTLTGALGGVLSVAFTADGRQLVAGSGDSLIRIWDLAAGEVTATFKGHEAGISAVASSPNGQLVASAGNDRTVRLWQTAPQRDSHVLQGPEERVSWLAFSPDCRHLAAAWYEAGVVKVWDLCAHQEWITLIGSPHKMISAVFSPDGKTLLTGGSDRIRLWEVGTGKELDPYPECPDHVIRAAFSPDGTVIAAVGRSASLWDVETRQQLAVLPGHEDWVSSLAFSPDGGHLATGCNDGRVRLWEVASRQLEGTLSGHQGPVYGIAFAPDGTKLAAAGGGPVSMWDTTRKALTATLKGHLGTSIGVAFSPDGKTLASAGNDDTVRLWNVATRQEVAVLKGHGSLGLVVAFSPDGRTLATGGKDGTVGLWQAAPYSGHEIQAGHPHPRTSG